MNRSKAREVFLMHRCDERFGRLIDNVLAKNNIELYDGWSKVEYQMVSKRCYNVYKRLNQYPKGFVKSWEGSVLPGVIVYVSDGEEIDVTKQKKKKHVTEHDIIVTLMSGRSLIYYGDVEWYDFECYVSEKRRKAETSSEFIKDLPVFSTNIVGEKVNPFTVNVLKVNSIGLLAQAPKYLSSLDTLIKGHEIFNFRGEVIIRDDFICNIFRYISVIGWEDTTRFYSISEIKDTDKLVIVPSLLLDDIEIALQLEALRFFKSKDKNRIVGTSGMHLIKMGCSNGMNFYFISLMKLSQGMMISNNDDLITFLLTNILYDAKIDILTALPAQINSVREVSKPISDAASLSVLKLRRTFLRDRTMNIVIVANKGSFKSTLIEKLQNYYDEKRKEMDFKLIDSDRYGQWITRKKKFSKSYFDENLDGEISYFEDLMSVTMSLHADSSYIKEYFGDEYIKMLTDSEYGVTPYQIDIGRYYNTGHRLIMFCHSIPEANCLSGNWQQFIVETKHDARLINGKRDLVLSHPINTTLFDVYETIGPSRDKLQWPELISILFPDFFQYLVQSSSSLAKATK